MTATLPELGRRERKKLATRRGLQAAALRLAAERGVDRLTVEEIADAVDVSSRTFFNYFPSKEAAIVDPDPDDLTELAEALAGRPDEEPPLAALRAVLAARVSSSDRTEAWLLRTRLVGEHPALLPRQLAAFACFERVIAEGIARRTGTDPDRDLYPVLAAAVATATLRTASSRWRLDTAARSMTELLDEAFDELAAGLRPPRRDTPDSSEHRTPDPTRERTP